MRRLLLAIFLLAVGGIPTTASAARLPDAPGSSTASIRFDYRAHDGRLRPAWLLLPRDYAGGSIPLVISPHGRGVGAATNTHLWGDLPGEGDFAVVNPAGEGRRTHLYSWGDLGQISDLARMPRVVRALGVNVDRRRVYAFGGSMGGQETLLLTALHPRLLAGSAVFDAPTDMARRYRDFAHLRNGAHLQALARFELGGVPAKLPRAYAARSPDTYARALAFSGVPLQLFWSTRDRVVADQREESAALADAIRDLNPQVQLWTFVGEWKHTAEMRAHARLPRALARFGLLPWSLAPEPVESPPRRHEA